MSGTRRRAGLLGSEVQGYRAWLERRGYTPATARYMLKHLGQVGRWLAVEGLTVGQLDEDRIAAFRASRRLAGYRCVPGARAMLPLLSYLREVDLAPPMRPALSTVMGELLGQYGSWMVSERNLAAGTVLRYVNTARRFLLEQAFNAGVFSPEGLSGTDVNQFLLRECGRVSAGSAKGRVAELRSILRFLHVQGITVLRLGTAVPPVGGWRLSGVPVIMTPADVQRLLDGCDRNTSVGIRDFAIMMFAARLGLRSIEVARLELGDIDWRAGELVVRGKARRLDRLPLPAAVGEAVVAYLADGRHLTQDRHLFLTCRAPRGPIHADVVNDVVERACLRVGLPRVGPHRLRHALAGELLAKGAGLVAISQVLRHQDLATTALYAKVDMDALAAVAQPWPGTSR